MLYKMKKVIWWVQYWDSMLFSTCLESPQVKHDWSWEARLPLNTLISGSPWWPPQQWAKPNAKLIAKWKWKNSINLLGVRTSQSFVPPLDLNPVCGDISPQLASSIIEVHVELRFIVADNKTMSASQCVCHFISRRYTTHKLNKHKNYFYNIPI